ncbi:pyrroloquinoline quinone biosynthesis protein D [Paucibacter oligotrophus]|uniref:Pyrroloquinoline quinone biosynthesis protein D n=1 Tax=Roseateles oligotrophus TaxID=1769250 RepID=A0A840L6Y7_9BURK|nr:pyrroloquinoline quinone biosynthesis peptide chaperone PqqD [Roseateles oligotrophus]MBB4842452.1 pyrroloquinoline quinone biosynthesis protein D [Roseateles oligotrophus]
MNSLPQIAHGYRLQWESAQQSHVLLYPEGMVLLNDSAAAILQRCDGRRSIADISAELELLCEESGLEPQVRDFLDIAQQQGWLA